MLNLPTDALVALVRRRAGGTRLGRPNRYGASLSAWLCLTLLTACLGTARAANWPMYQHDIARTGIAAEALPFPLREQWMYRPLAGPDPGWSDPQSVPLEGNLELPRVKFDDAFHAVAADGRVYFGSSSDNKVYCLDARTGQVRWTFFTAGPVRLAPMLYKGKVYFGSDDGFAYCLDAATGARVWQVHGGPTDERVLGHGRMISLWPIRTSVLVDGDTAYFAAGIFPGERIYVHAVRADDGTPLWTNDTISDRSNGRDGFSPQGYLLASATSLFVPTGRSLPAAFSRKDGSFLFQSSGSWRSVGVVGGTYAFLQGEDLYTGTEQQIYTAAQATGKLGAASFPGKRVVMGNGLTYVLNEAGLTAFDTATFPEAGRRLKTAQVRRASLNEANPKPKDYKQQLEKLDVEEAAARKAMEASVRWTLPRRGLQALIAAGEFLVAGGQGEVIAVTRGAGKLLWQAKVDGAAKGLAVSDGRLFVSTDTGAVHCFGAPAPLRTAMHGSPRPRELPAPDAAGRLCSAAARDIVARTGITRGYCLVLGCANGRLAYELARRTELKVYAVDPDAKRVQAARRVLDQAGVYGTRVTVDQGSLESLPYSEYSANLVVSEEALLTGKLSTPAREVLRVLKPCGGMICLGQPSGATGGAVLDEGALRAWLGSEFAGSEVTRRDGLWARFTRGALEGAGSWTHQYGDPGNTASSDDTRVKCPLGVLWYGEPGPDKVPSRHLGNTAPLSINGRVFLQGENRILCFDAYNGQMYWERQLQGAYRVGMVRGCGNLAANADSLFAALEDKCVRLDAATGRTLATYTLPPSPEKKKRRWSYLALSGGILFGGVALDAQFSSMVFALDPGSGRLLWTHPGTKIRDNTIAISDGRVLFADDRATSEQRQQALRPRIDELMAKKKIDAAAAEKELKSADVRVVLALDAATGAKAWEKPLDLTDCGMHVLTAMATRGVLLFCGSHPNGHLWPQFLAGEYAARRATALSIADGSLLWSKPLGYRIRPMIIGDTLYAEPWAFDIHTGEQKMRTNPVTGLESIWEWERPGHHCGNVAGAPNMLVFRSYSAAYYDLLKDQGTEHFAGQRSGCWINTIPANGLVVMPEASSGCVCLFSIHCTTVFKPRELDKAWGMFSDRAPTTPVKHLAVNLGGPGDRKDAAGKLWLGYPRPSARMQLTFPMTVSGVPGGGFFSSAAEGCKVTGTATPFVYASGYSGLTKCTLPLVKPGDGAAVYTVRLGFADTENTAAGQRVFDIKLQGKTVATGFDIIDAAGGPNKAVTREFRGIPVEGALTLELVPKAPAPAPAQAPVLNLLEIERERVLNLGLQAPSFTLSDLDKEQAATVTVANYTDREFNGTLRLEAPDGFTLSPETAAVKLAAGATTAVPVRAAVARKGARGNFDARVRLIWADGTVEGERQTRIEYLGARGRVTIKAVADTYVNGGTPDGNFGQLATILVDGGNQTMGDAAHNIAYLRFPLALPGKPISATLRIRITAAENSESNDSGRIYRVTDPWDENRISYANRPKQAAEVAVLGKVARDTWAERKLNVNLSGLKELCLVLMPTSTDGASYCSRETGANGPELVVEYEAAE